MSQKILCLFQKQHVRSGRKKKEEIEKKLLKKKQRELSGVAKPCFRGKEEITVVEQ